MDVIIEPAGTQWLDLVRHAPTGSLFGRSLAEWREQTRIELGLAIDRPIIATGHQTLLWHPGILAKYLAAHALAEEHDLGRANLVVDQHIGEFGSFEIPIRRQDESLSVRR